MVNCNKSNAKKNFTNSINKCSSQQTSSALTISGGLDLCCNNLLDVSNIYFCNNTALLGSQTGILTLSGELDMSCNSITDVSYIHFKQVLLEHKEVLK